MQLHMVEGDQSRAADSLLSHVQSIEHPSTSAAQQHPSQPDQSQSAAAAGPSPRQTQGRMRSSIACTHCRRSKVKCVNNGVGTPCRACENAGRECTYPTQPTGSGAHRRRESVTGRPEGNGDAERRKKQARMTSTHTFAAQAHAAATVRGGESTGTSSSAEALDLRLLTADVWLELHDLFEKHYSADFPFVHAVTFRKPLDNAKQKQQSLRFEEIVPVKPHYSDLWLLSFLALTARFHPKLVAYHKNESQRSPRDASEYYAVVATGLLEPFSDAKEDLETIQAYLMLGMHKFGMCQGLKAWKIVGAAVRSAQAMGLQYSPNSDGRQDSASVVEDDSDVFLTEEVNRRTFWSCFIMDRYTSNGTRRPQLLHTKDITATLPASERKFAFKSRVQTLPLSGTDLSGEGVPGQSEEFDRPPLETGQHEGCVSRYVKAMDLYNKVVRWSCNKGRRSETYPPWDERCKFFKLREEARTFSKEHPYEQKMNMENTQNHIHSRSATPYMLTHVVYLLSQIFLHREYVPFLPLSCKKPEGPLDEPMFPPDKYQVPDRFWETSANECFSAARKIIDLANTCQFHGHGVETPIIGFAIYIVTFVGHYCILFPNMDPQGQMCTPASQRDQVRDEKTVSKGVEAAAKANQLLNAMKPKLVLAYGWSKTCKQVAKFMKDAKSHYEKNDSVGHEAGGERRLLGGGLEDYEKFERRLTEFGSLDDAEMSEADPQSENHSPNSSPEMAEVKTERNDPRTAASSTTDPYKAENGGGSWIPINAPIARPSPMSVATNPSLFRSFDTPHQPQQTPQHSSQWSTFKAPYSGDTTNAANRPSLLSPSVTTQPSTPFERQNSYSSSSGWTPQPSGYTTNMQPLQQPKQQQQQQHPPLAYHGGSIPPSPYSNTSQQALPAPGQQEQQQPERTEPKVPQEDLDYARQLSLAAEDLEIFVYGSDPTAQPLDGRNAHPTGWLETAQLYGELCIR